MLKEHPFLVTTTFRGDGDTIKYDITKPNRSDAVGKAFKLNANGIGELVEDGDDIEGKVIAVDDDNRFTGVYLCGGVTLPLGAGATVARGDKLVGALGTGSVKGHVKTVSDAAVIAANVDSFAELPAVINRVIDLAQSKCRVLDFDTTNALVSMGA